MNLRSFYEALLPSAGAYALFHVPTKRHRWFDSLDALTQATESLADQHSWYYAVGSFSDHARTQANVLAKRALYLDIDAGPDKFERDPANAYPDAREALIALKEFCADLELPFRVLVFSGAGLHAYWPLEHDVDPQTWQMLADRLKAAAKAAGLKADPTCTADSARVLRPIGQLHKNGQRVTLLKHSDKRWSVSELAAKLPEVAPSMPELPARKAVLDVNGDVLPVSGPPSSALKIVAECGALREVADAKGNVAEPLWRAMIGLVKHTVEGEAQIHEWSSGYAGYDHGETQAKIDRYEAGPTTCAKFEEYSKACGTCPHAGKFKSPIQLGKMGDAEVAALPEPLPPPPAPPKSSAYPDVFGEDFIVMKDRGKDVLGFMRSKLVETADGQKATEKSWEPLTATVFWFDEWVEAGEGEGENAQSRMVKVLRDGTWVRYPFPDATAADRKKISEYLLNKGIIPISQEPAVVAAMQKYVLEQLRRIRANRDRPVLRERFGFQFDRTGAFICAHGENVIYPDGTIRTALLGPDMLVHKGMGLIRALPESTDGVWSREVWVSHIRPAAHKQVEFLQRWYGGNVPAARLVIAMHLAAPLMAFASNALMRPGEPLPPVGATISLYSSASGRGKTTAMQAGAAVFGSPEVLVHRGSKGGITRNAASARVAAIGTGAFDLDEVTRDVAGDAAELIDSIASGTDKMRANVRGKVARAPATFAVIGFVSTNMPQRDLLASVQTNSDALQQRLIELNFDAQPPLDAASVAQYMAAYPTDMAPYLGALGAVIHLSCVTMGPEKMHNLLSSTISKAFAELGGEAKERFAARTLACLMVAHMILDKVGLWPFEISEQIAEFKKAVEAGRGNSATTVLTGIDQFRRMMADLSPYFLLTNNESVGGGKNDILENASTLRSPVIGRQVRAGRYTYVAVDAIKRWCRAENVSYTQMMDEVRAAAVLLPIGESLMAVHHISKAVTGVSQIRTQCVKVSHDALYGAEGVAPNVVDLATKEAAAPSAHENQTGTF